MTDSLKDIHNTLLELMRNKPVVSSKELHEALGTRSYATVKRGIQWLVDIGYIEVTGKGKATRYAISPAYKLVSPIEPDRYFEKEVDERDIEKGFNLALIKTVLMNHALFNSDEIVYLNLLQNEFRKNTESLNEMEFRNEFERLAIDLSWKSSQIEGNTYSLLETERLLKNKEEATGKTRDEATMLLNHKAALDFIIDHTNYVHPLTISGIEDIHSLLVKDLNIDRNLRKRRVGISGTNYKPLDNEFQIREAMSDMCHIVNAKENVFEKALLVLMLISYIQPFTDGNKRTARIISNAILMNQHYCPISFRTVDSMDYKKAMLIFYEQNNISAFKKIFIGQFEFAVKTYF